MKSNHHLLHRRGAVRAWLGIAVLGVLIGLALTRTGYYPSLSHSKWDCRYHVVFVPEGRKKQLYGKIREYLKSVFYELARQRGCKIVEGHMSSDHVHMCLSIPPKHAVAEVIGYIKGKSAIGMARQYSGRQKNFNGECFWARGYAVSTVGHDEAQIRDYIRRQEEQDSQADEGRF